MKQIEQISFRVDAKLKKQLREIAEYKGINDISSLMRMYIKEGVRKDDRERNQEN